MNYTNENRGALFKNDKKTSDKHPDFSGTLDVGGVEHWINGWRQISKNGVKYMALRVKPKELVSAPTKKAKQADTTASAPYDDEIPF